MHVIYLVSIHPNKAFFSFLFSHFCITVEDQERNNGKDKPYFMSDELKKIINVKNVVTPEDVERSKRKNDVEVTEVA